MVPEKFWLEVAWAIRWVSDRVGVGGSEDPPMKMEQAECSETSAYKIQTPGNYPKKSIKQ